ncbi:MAG: N-formylglutamate amidohydrolase [Pseudomonadota bacterium]
MIRPVATLAPRGTPAPLVFDSPHSGSIYPANFEPAIDRMILRRSEDAHVDELFAHVVDQGATFVHALFPRVYVDPNRAEDDVDLAMIEGAWTRPVNPSFKTVDRGVGLIWRDMKAFGPIYAGRLSAASVEARIERFWRPYQTALAEALDAVHDTFGRVIHVNCHSMASMGDRTTEDGEVPRPDFVISDRDGTTCAPDVIDCVVGTVRDAGYSAAVNNPYKGFELVRRHGRPTENRHSLQIEINRALYMEERTLSKVPGFFAVEEILRRVTAELRTLADRL